MAVNKGAWLRGAREFGSAKLILLDAWDSILQRRRVMEFCPLEDGELETVSGQRKAGETPAVR